MSRVSFSSSINCLKQPYQRKEKSAFRSSSAGSSAYFPLSTSAPNRLSSNRKIAAVRLSLGYRAHNHRYSVLHCQTMQPEARFGRCLSTVAFGARHIVRYVGQDPVTSWRQARDDCEQGRKDLKKYVDGEFESEVKEAEGKIEYMGSARSAKATVGKVAGPIFTCAAFPSQVRLNNVNRVYSY